MTNPPDNQREDWHDGPEPPRDWDTYFLLAVLAVWLGVLAWLIWRLWRWSAARITAVRAVTARAGADRSGWPLWPRCLWA